MAEIQNTLHTPTDISKMLRKNYFWISNASLWEKRQRKTEKSTEQTECQMSLTLTGTVIAAIEGLTLKARDDGLVTLPRRQ